MLSKLLKCCALVVLFVPVVASAQITEELLRLPHEITLPQSLEIQPATYGTVVPTVVAVNGFAFTNFTAGQTMATANYRRYSNNQSCCLEAHISLPAGALITRFELDGCDSSATGALVGIMARATIGAGGVGGISPLINSGTAATPGCNVFAADVIPPVAVDNGGNSYFIEFSQNGDVSGAVALRSARVYYMLRVSDAPGTATFLDVPVGHPQHRFVEALVAAGITAGCGGGNYCPTQAVTRGQMAVFLAAALGLHWAP